MILITLICLLVSLLFFVIAKKLNKYVRYIVTALIAFVPAILLIFLMLTGDKAPIDTPIIYLGPNMIANFEQEKQYKNLLEIGKEFELKGKYKEAILEYKKASKVNRVALPSYYALLNIANAQYLIKDTSGCKKSLLEFIRLAEIEINPQLVKNPPFTILDNTGTRLTDLKSDINKAKNLLARCTQ